MENSGVSKLISTQIYKLIEMSTTFISSDVPMHKMEMIFLKQLLQVGRSLLVHVIEEKSVLIAEQEIDVSPKLRYKNTGKKTRNYLSIFGLISILRPTIKKEIYLY